MGAAFLGAAFLGAAFLGAAFSGAASLAAARFAAFFGIARLADFLGIAFCGDAFFDARFRMLVFFDFFAFFVFMRVFPCWPRRPSILPVLSPQPSPAAGSPASPRRRIELHRAAPRGHRGSARLCAWTRPGSE